MIRSTARFWRDEAGAASVEYGLMAALIGGTIVVTVSAIGLQLNTLFTVLDQTLVIAGP